MKDYWTGLVIGTLVGGLFGVAWFVNVPPPLLAVVTFIVAIRTLMEIG